MGKWGGEISNGVYWGYIWRRGKVRKYCHLFIDGLSRLPHRAKKSTPFEQNIYTTYKVVTKDKIEILPP